MPPPLDAPDEEEDEPPPCCCACCCCKAMLYCHADMAIAYACCSAACCCACMLACCARKACSALLVHAACFLTTSFQANSCWRDRASCCSNDRTCSSFSCLSHTGHSSCGTSAC